jgi:hypothetical protein
VNDYFWMNEGENPEVTSIKQEEAIFFFTEKQK